MQTFLPYQNFNKTAKHLDYRRLGKQRVEAWQIYCAITDPTYGWQNHPAVEMWRHHPRLLALYGYSICQEWKFNRGHKDSLGVKFYKVLRTLDELWMDGEYFEELPFWWNDERLFSSHRSNLLRKNPEYYSQFGWDEPDNLPYFWPTRELDVVK